MRPVLATIPTLRTGTRTAATPIHIAEGTGSDGEKATTHVSTTEPPNLHLASVEELENQTLEAESIKRELFSLMIAETTKNLGLLIPQGFIRDLSVSISNDGKELNFRGSSSNYYMAITAKDTLRSAIDYRIKHDPRFRDYLEKIEELTLNFIVGGSTRYQPAERIGFYPRITYGWQVPQATAQSN